MNDQDLNLNIPNPPRDLPYSEYEDFRNGEILKVNGISLSEDELIVALKEKRNVLQAAVAHMLGSLKSTAAIPILKELVTSPEDLVKVEAAYALARLGIPEGKQVLIDCLNYPVDAYLFPAIAAGYLAQLGDPQGFSTILKCFEVNIPAIRMLACKQLYFFVRFHGQQNENGSVIDVYDLFNRALKDSDTDIQWQALAQLKHTHSDEARKVLEHYVESAQDEQLRKEAREILTRPAE